MEGTCSENKRLGWCGEGFKLYGVAEFVELLKQPIGFDAFLALIEFQKRCNNFLFSFDLVRTHFPFCSTMLPSNEPDVTPVCMFTKRSSVKVPVAPAKAPVPPVMVCCSTTRLTSGVAVGSP